MWRLVGHLPQFWHEELGGYLHFQRVNVILNIFTGVKCNSSYVFDSYKTRCVG